jgi:hypothetical protein
MTPSGIEPATFRLVAQCLNKLRHQQRAHWMVNMMIITIQGKFKLPHLSFSIQTVLFDKRQDGERIAVTPVYREQNSSSLV